MKSLHFVTLLLIISILIISMLILIKFNEVPNNDFSELYFNEFESLPKSIKPSEPLEFSFTVVNIENTEMTYQYIVTFKNNDVETILDNNEFILNSGEKQTFQEQILIEEGFNMGLVSVKLLNKNQEIHFWIRKDDS
ncbi:MAG TPA: hypothetical protein VJH20_03070 [Candidatus Nanoarchaeia archaeon]|nr:hypothetical protein [Candidatus Nanoarchaeia archaeon]